MAEESAEPKKRGPGRPKKNAKLDDVTFSDVEKLFESLEKKLRVSLSGLIAEAMAPLRSLIFSQAKTLEDSVSRQLEEINSRVS